MPMRNRKTVKPVLVGVALAMAASLGFFVEGETAGTLAPGLHPTTEVAVAALHDGGGPAAAVEVDVPAPSAKAPQKKAAAARAVKARAKSNPVPPGYVYWKTVRAKVTAYEPSRRSCGKFANGKTSVGQNAWRMDGVATDPRAIPYGTVCVIPGVGVRKVDDTGSAMRRSWRRHRRFHIDVRMTYFYQARRWGVKYLDVKLYKKAR